MDIRMELRVEPLLDDLHRNTEMVWTHENGRVETAKVLIVEAS